MHARPTLIIVSGRPGAGKTTLAHLLAKAIPCPAISRDEIKEGMVHATPNYEARTDDELTRRTFPLFFQTLRLLLASGVTVVAEAAFQDQVWQPQVSALSELATFRIIRCHTDHATRLGRRVSRMRNAHDDFKMPVNAHQPEVPFDHINVAAPTIDVDTTSDYQPTLEALVAFVNSRP